MEADLPRGNICRPSTHRERPRTACRPLAGASPLAPQLLAPFGLWNSNYWIGLFPYFFMAVLMLGCDEVASQLEDPFSLLPVDDILFVATRDVKK